VFVDDVLVPDPTPAAIAQLLNTQEPKELTAVDVLGLAQTEAG
jgi:hypothetical protein